VAATSALSAQNDTVLNIRTIIRSKDFIPYPAEDKQIEYGSMYPMCHAEVVSTMTKERTAQLRRILDGEDPCGVSDGSK
jgi:hypothetical protein